MTRAEPAVRTSVLVVGAGPTGLLLASELRRRGVPCHLIGRRRGGVALGSNPELPLQIGQLQPAAADLLGIKGTTLLVVRPDGYVGLRSDRNHLAALESYRALVHSGQT